MEQRVDSGSISARSSFCDTPVPQYANQLPNSHSRPDARGSLSAAGRLFSFDSAGRITLQRITAVLMTRQWATSAAKAPTNAETKVQNQLPNGIRARGVRN